MKLFRRDFFMELKEQITSKNKDLQYEDSQPYFESFSAYTPKRF